MSIKAILIHVEARRGADGVIPVATQLAAELDARLIGVGAALPHPLVQVTVPGIVDAGFIEYETKEIDAELKAAAARFGNVTAAAKVRSEWRRAVTFPVTAMLDAAPAADLIVVARGDPEKRDAYQSVDPGDLLMAAGRPVLIVPPGSLDVKAASPLVAWRNTREARRALADALPLLQRAQSAVLVAIRPDAADEASLADATGFLGRHGVVARAEVLKAGEEATTTDELLRFIDRTYADLVVAGAYGHNRLREWVFGGVTRGLLTRSPIPCLLSH